MADTVEITMAEVRDGGIPFGAMVIDGDGNTLGTGVNRVAVDGDSSAHAEIVALRNAQARHGRAAIAGAILLASGEPCGMCYAAARERGIGCVLFAVDCDEAAAHGFDYRESYERWPLSPASAPIDARHLPVESSLGPFVLWKRLHQ